MLNSFEVSPVVEGLRFAEGPRWRDGSLWFSDIEQNKVLRLDAAGVLHTVAEIERPSGLGFLPDGTLLVSSMTTRTLFRVRDGHAAAAVDLSALGSVLNDMVVLPNGRAYVDCYRPGPAFAALAGPNGEPQADAVDVQRYYVNGLGMSPSLRGEIALVTEDGGVRRVAEDINYPNGLAVTPDGGTLVVSVSHECKLIAFDISADGGLTRPRIWAELPGRHPDGICLDSEGAVWVACVATSSFVRVLEGGRITHQIPTHGRWAVAVALGGADRRTLYMVSMESADLPGHRSWIDMARVDAPGAGWP